ncbi:MAG: GNAT family N-acetyltransferase [Acholeplasmataceae bacterium]|nr:GNAT family N-acetyltransferase [Acholeplasmataceae bacterium]
MIRKAQKEDLLQILEIVHDAKELLKKNGIRQWQTPGYPGPELILEDIRKDYLYVADYDGVLAGMASLVREPDENYLEIYEGQWLNDEPYFSIHRIAVRKEFYGRGIAKDLFKHLELCTKEAGLNNIRVDTSLENQTMHHLLLANKYQRCGKIYLKGVEDNPLRIAYQKIIFLNNN